MKDTLALNLEADTLNLALADRTFNGRVENDSGSSDEVLVYIQELQTHVWVMKCADVLSKSWHCPTSCIMFKKDDAVQLTVFYSVTTGLQGLPIIILDVFSCSGGYDNRINLG